MSEIAVIGGGLAGLSAARHAARLGRLVTLFEGTGMYGGQVATVDHVDGLPFPGALSGQDVAIGLLEDARKVGIRVVEVPVARVTADKGLRIETEDGEEYRPGAIVVATGGARRPLGVENEDSYMGRGLSACAACDGGFFRGQDVAVIGGGDAAVHEALLLSKLAGTVTMVCRSPVRAKREYVEKLAAKDNVKFVWDSEVSAILGEDEITGLRLRDVRDGSTSEMSCTGVFPFIGSDPVTGFLPAKARDPDGFLCTDSEFETRVPGLFAAGAVRAGYGGNAVEALAEGIGAAASAVRSLASIVEPVEQAA